MAGGITPNRIVTIPLEEYNPEYYLTLLYQAMLNLDWNIGYFDHDGIIAYTNISWESYSEEVSVRLKDNNVIIKSECVGYQAWWYDYGKNQKNLDLLFGEITYAEFHLQNELEETTQELMNSIPEKQFLTLEDPPMAGKEQLRGFFSPFIPVKKYLITPLLVIINTLIFIATTFLLSILPRILFFNHFSLHNGENVYEKIYMWMGVNNRKAVLNGQIWRLLTNTFMHFSLIHLVSNMIVLVYIGSLIEWKLGKWNYLLMYLYTGITASMVSVIWDSADISAGASGAIFGLFGILLALLSTDFYEKSARKALLISTAIFVAYNIIPVGEGVDHAAHFGGLVSGYLLGWLAYLGLTHKNSFIKKWGIGVAGAAFVIIFVSCAVSLSPQYQKQEYLALQQKADSLETTINGDIYNNADSLTREKKLDILEHKTSNQINDLQKTGERFNHLVLSYKMKKEAKAKAKLVVLECQIFRLLCREYMEEDNYKYQPAIDSLTNQINIVRNVYTQSL
jgi:rhomboid protease GluP